MFHFRVDVSSLQAFISPRSTLVGRLAPRLAIVPMYEHTTRMEAYGCHGTRSSIITIYPRSKLFVLMFSDGARFCGTGGKAVFFSQRVGFWKISLLANRRTWSGLSDPLFLIYTSRLSFGIDSGTGDLERAYITFYS